MMKNNTLLGLTLALSITMFGCSAPQADKISIIVSSLQLEEAYKQNYQFVLSDLKTKVDSKGQASLKEIEAAVTEAAIKSRIHEAIENELNEQEIDDLYKFVQTSAYDKLINQQLIYKSIEKQFLPIEAKIEKLYSSYTASNKAERQTFEAIPVDRKNGFYESIDYQFGMEWKDVTLKKEPSITFSDVKQVEKSPDPLHNESAINIIFTEEGKEKFRKLTKENLGKPIAVVIDKKIISIPIVNAEIKVGRATISGYYSDEDIKRFIGAFQSH